MADQSRNGWPGPNEPDVPLNLAIIIASVRTRRLGGTVGSWFVEQAARHEDLKLDVIDLRETPLPADMGVTPQVEAFAERIGSADAFVVVTPEYNHGYPAALKLAIDVVKHEWFAKPVGFVCYGGMSGGLRAVEQLRLVFAELHMTCIRDTVSFHLARTCFDEHGQPRDPAGVAAAAATMLGQLGWWARALRAARTARPFAPVLLNRA